MHRWTGWQGLAAAAALSALVWPSLLCAAVPPPAHFQYFKELSPPAEAGHKVAALEVDEDLFAACDELAACLRLRDGKDQEVPFLLRAKVKTVTVVREERVSTSMSGLKQSPDNRLELVVTRTNPDSFRSETLAVEFRTALKDFEKQVSVYGSEDGATWTPLAEAVPIFDYSRYVDLRNARVTLAPNRFRRYRVEIGNIEESRKSPWVNIVRDVRQGQVYSEQEHLALQRADFRIDDIAFFTRVEEQKAGEAVVRPYTVEGLEVKEDAAKKQTVATFRTRRAPLSRLVLDTDSANFSRRVTVEGSDREAGEEWAPLASATLSRIAVGGYARDACAVELDAASRCRRYRLTIDNQDSPPIHVRAVQAKGQAWELLFLRDPPGPYRVWYGSVYRGAPHYDIAAVLAPVPWTETDAFSGGAQQANPAFSVKAERKLPVRGILIVAVVLTVMVLGLFIGKAAKSVEKLPEE